MKPQTRALLTTTAALLGFFTATAPAQADAKKECATAYEKTQSLREIGQLRDARKQAIVCSAPTCSAYVTKDCLQWLTEIDANLPTVVFTARNAAGEDTLAVRVTVDGHPVAEKLDGKAVPLDPGEHVVRFEMTGAEAVEQKVMIRQGEKNRSLVASFKKAASITPLASPPASPPPASAPPLTLAAPEPDTAPLPAPRSEGVPLWAWISGGVGVVALGVGAGFGVSALTAQRELDEKCGGDATRCPMSLQSVTVPLADQRNRNRNVFIGLEAAAVVGIGVAVVGIVRSHSKASSPRTGFVVAPFGSPSGGGVEMQGQF
jgi:hypothetical protein